MPTRRVATFGKLAIGDEICDVTFSTSDEIRIRTKEGKVRRFTFEEEFESDSPAETGLQNLKGTLNPVEQREAGYRVQHLVEAMTGFASGDPDAARPGEPRPEYDKRLVPVKLDRFANKGKELGVSPRQLQRWEKDLREQGLLGLADGRTQKGKTGSKAPATVVDALRTVFAELGPRSDVTKNQVRILVAMKMNSDELPAGSRSTFNRLYDQMAKTASMNRPAKARRSVLSGPHEKMGFLPANRPGEVIVMDSTRADIFALDPATGDWVGLELSVALDLATRSVVSFSLTPISTKGVDLVYMLADICSPRPVDNKWPDDIPYPYTGVPEQLLLEAHGLEEGTPLKPKPSFRPEMLLIDRGRNYQSASVTAACVYLGTHIQSARKKRPQDKGWIERLLGVVQVQLFQMLPGYTGPNPQVRGEAPEEQMVYTINELQQILGRYFAEIYQNTPHDGLRLPEMPEVRLTPNEAYEEGIRRAGFVSVPLDPDFHLHLLPAERRTISPDGIKNKGLKYDSAILDPYRPIKPPSVDGKWPVRIDVRDLRQIWFQDPAGTWHEIPWRFAREFDRPFSLEALQYVKEKLVSGPRPSEREIAQRLFEFCRDLKDITKVLKEPALRRESARTTFTETEPRAAEYQLVKPTEPNPEVIWDDDIPELETRND